MDIYIILFIITIILLFFYWCYIKYNEKNKIQNLSNKIKNNITITTYNMKQFLNLSNYIKRILLDIAYEYKHDDIINLMTKN